MGQLQGLAAQKMVESWMQEVQLDPTGGGSTGGAGTAPLTSEEIAATLSALSPSELTQALHAASNLSMDPNFDPVQVQQLLAAQGYSATEIATFLYLVQKQQMLNP